MIRVLLPNKTMSKTEILIELTRAFEQNDLSFIETVNNITYGYKVQLKQNLTKQNQNDRKN